jgi:hypothetical protein
MNNDAPVRDKTRVLATQPSVASDTLTLALLDRVRQIGSLADRLSDRDDAHNEAALPARAAGTLLLRVPVGGLPLSRRVREGARIRRVHCAVRPLGR